MKTSLLRRDRLPDLEKTDFALSPPDSTLPVLSQGDHPVLGTPSWYLHPCEMAGVIGEILEEKEKESGGERGMTLVETWMMIVGGTVNLVGE